MMEDEAAVNRKAGALDARARDAVDGGDQVRNVVAAAARDDVHARDDVREAGGQVPAQKISSRKIS